ncbi:hypothetical protein [Malaciobacter mytili]|uniref:hypothetical protein n=1 Tax=Malaciobacter mytili TaxID=603050 RepID=UPI003A8A8D0F
MKLNKLILTLVLSVISLLGATPNEIIGNAENKVNNTVENTVVKKYLSQNSQYIKDMVGKDNCLYSCPTLKEGYFGRVASVNPQSGETQCYVYDSKLPDKRVATVKNISKPCVQSFQNVVKNATTLTSTKTPSEMSLESYEDLKAIEDKYYKNYGDVGAGREFINVPKYMIAGLTVDEEIIDVKSTIMYNQITLNSGYTLYPNSSNFNEADFKEKIQENQTWYKNLWDNAKDLVGLYDLPDPSSEAERVEYSNLVSPVKAMLTNSVIFIMNFLNEYNDVMLIGKTYILFTVIPLTIGLAVLSKITKLVSGVSDFEDITERIVLGIATMFIFFFSTTNIKIDEENKISQTSFHQIIRPVLYKGAYLGDLAGQSATKAYLKYKLREVGLAPLEVVNSTIKEKVKLENEQLIYSSIMNDCGNTYNTEALKQYIGVTVGLNQTYPPSENLKRYSSQIAGDTYTNFYNKTFLKSEQLIRTHNLSSVSLCYQAERSYLENKEKIKDYEYLIKGYELSNQNNGMKKQLELLANMQFRNDVELGFASLPLLATTSVFIDNLGVFENPLGERLDKEQMLKDYRSSGGYEVGNIAEGDNLLTKPINWTLSNLSYTMLPFASGIQNTVYKLLKNEDSHDSFRSIIGNAVESFSSIKTGVFGIAKELVTSLSSNLLANENVVQFLSIFISILIMMYLISYLPIIAIAGASFSVIFFYYLSIEIYYLVIPFLIAFAFATSQSELIKNFMKNGLILAIKPLLIVISIVMALFAKEFFETMNYTLVNWQFEPMFAMTQSVDLSSFSNFKSNIATYVFADFGLIFFKGFLILANSVIGIIVVFYLVLNGANMILDMFGVRDASFDVQSSIGSQVDGKTSQWNTPI